MYFGRALNILYYILFYIIYYLRYIHVHPFVKVTIVLFSEFMNSSPIKDPPELRRKMELFTAEQRTLNKKRLDFLESLRFVIKAYSIILDYCS